MRSSALAGFLASAVLVSGSAGFASTFLVGPYLGEQVRHQSPRAVLMSSAAPMDPLAILQIPAANAASLEGEAPASQTAHRPRQVQNTSIATVSASPTVTPAVVTTTSGEMPGPITEDAFASRKPATLPVSSGGPLIATEASTAMVSSKLENGEPVLTLRIAPFIAPSAPAADVTDPDNAVEPTVISAPPSEQALATPAVAAAPEPAPERQAEPVAPSPPEPQAKPRMKPAALKQPVPAPAEPTRRAKPRAQDASTPARVTTTSAPAPAAASLDDQIETPPAPPPAPDPLNAPYSPAQTFGPDESAATGAPAPTTPSSAEPETTSGPTPLTMPQ